MKVDISNGELIDKITILEIKMDMIKSESRLANVRKELDILRKLEFPTPLKRDLKSVNEKIWHCEDKIRFLTKERLYSESFIECAKQIHILNDERASIKKQINIETASEIVEEKSY